MKLLALTAVLAFSTQASELDAPRLDGTVRLCNVSDVRAEENVARYVIKLETENEGYKKAHIEPVVLVLLVAAGLLLGVGVGAGIATAARPAP